MTARIWEQTDEIKDVRIKHYRQKAIGYVTLANSLFESALIASKELEAGYGDVISINGVHFIFEQKTGLRRMSNFELMDSRFESVLPPAS